MEFKSLDVNNSVFYVSNNSDIIRYNQTLLPITKIFTFSPDNFKIETSQYILKYSKGILNVYNKNNTLKETFAKLKDTLQPNTQQPNTLKFVLKENYIIEFLADETTIKNNGIVESILSKTEIGGLWISYDTNQGNRLWISKDPLYHHKWNGIPIGKI